MSLRNIIVTNKTNTPLNLGIPNVPVLSANGKTGASLNILRYTNLEEIDKKKVNLSKLIDLDFIDVISNDILVSSSEELGALTSVSYYEATKDSGSGGGVTGTGTDDRLARWNGTDDIQNSSVTLNDDGDILPTTDDSQDLGSNTLRWQDIYLGPGSLHLGTSTSDEGIFSYNTSTNILTIGTNSDSDILSISSSAVDIDNLTLSGSSAALSTIRTVLRADGVADDVSAVTEKAVRDAVDASGTVSGTGFIGSIAVWDGPGLFQFDTAGDIGDSLWSIDSTGNLYQNSFLVRITDGGNIISGGGTFSEPGFTSTGDTNTGIYFPSADILGITTGGSSRATFSATSLTSTVPIYAPTGNAAAPSISFSGDPDTGLYSSDLDEIGISVGGTLRYLIDEVGIFPSSDDTYDLGSNSLRWQDIYLGPATIHIGTSTVDEGQISYNTSTNTLTIGTNSDTDIISITGSSVDIGSLTIAGSAASISTIRTTIRADGVADDISIATEKAIRDAVDAVSGGGGITGSGTDNRIVRWDGTGNVQDSDFTISDATGQMSSPVGSAAAPTYTFTGNTDTGIYRTAVNEIGLALGGTEAFSVVSISGSTGFEIGGIGIFRFNTTRILADVSFHADTGSAATPSITFGIDTDTGLYRNNFDELGVAIGGSEAFSVDGVANGAILDNGGTEMLRFTTSEVRVANPLRLPGGSNTAPSLTFTSDTNTGLYNPAADELGVTLGTNAWKMDGQADGAIIETTAGAAILSFSPSLVSVSSTAFRITDGTVSAPSFSFTGDTNTGLYRIAADTIGIATTGTLRFSISTTSIDATIPHRAGNGTSSVPSFSFTSDTNTGMYRVGSDQLGFSTGSSLRLTISTTALASTLPFLNQNGSAGSPSYSFTNEPDCGMYLIGGNTIGFSTNGLSRFNVDGNGNIKINTTAGLNGAPANVISIGIGTAPTLGTNNITSIWSEDISGGGLTGLKMIYSNGSEFTIVGAGTGEVAASTGIGTVLMGSVNNANSAGFLQLTSNNGTLVYVPYWTTATP